MHQFFLAFKEGGGGKLFIANEEVTIKTSLQ
jgi:hypothetical protein